MRVIRCLLAVVLFFGLAAGVSAEHHESALMEEVAAIGDAVSKAMVENDFEFLLGVYAEDAVSLPNFGPRMQGLDAFRRSHEMMTAAGMKVLSFESDPTEVWQAGDQVIEIGTFTIELVMPGLPTNITDRGKYLYIWERNAEGELKLKTETWNTDMNPMEMCAAMAGPPSGSQEGEPLYQGRDD